MKKISVIFLALFVAAAAVLFVSCSKKNKDEAPAPVTAPVTPETTSDEENDVYFLPRIHAAECYFSYYGSGSFGSYTAAFPERWKDYYAAELGMSRDEFEEAVVTQCESLASLNAQLYGEYEVQFLNTQDETIAGDELEAIKSSLSACGIDPASLSQAVRGYYNLSYVSAADTTQVLREELAVVTFIKLAKTSSDEDYGWYVLPDDFHKVV